jgi:hypothetical protein
MTTFGCFPRLIGYDEATMAVRQTRVFVRSQEPADDWWTTLAAKVFRPLTSEFAASLRWFWFSRYGASTNDEEDCDITKIPADYKHPAEPGGAPFHRSMRFRFDIADDQQQKFKQRLEDLVLQGGYAISDVRDYPRCLEDTGGNRFLGIENRQPGRPEQRSKLVLGFYHITSQFVLDALVGPDGNGRFKLETNDDKANNPRGSTFQSLLHLFCNITEVPTDVWLFRNHALNLIGYGTFMYAPAAPPGGWEPEVISFSIRY